uniref:NADH-ubiquinone oxidoreductase chain 2 n=1 Tax=Thrips setosus TaxID=163897 RepID=A0A8K1RNY2_9NEOP|nr:NADH dehydrogenase subunit 2 [Thrips setosus]
MKNLFFIQKNLFLVSLISSIFICLSSSSFLSMWMSMEINLFSMIPLMSEDQKTYSEKSTMIYFLIQSVSSSIVIICVSFNSKDFKSLTMMMIFLAIFVKLGMFPFHIWMICTIEGMSWNLAFFMMTLQKIIPISILMLFIHQETIIMFCLLNSFIVAFSGITMFSMRKIMGFSSINHLSLMLMAMVLSKKTFKMYFFIYSFMTYTSTKIMKKTNTNFLFQTLTIFKSNKLNNLVFLILFLSMAGIPPLLGFMPKLMTILIMMKSNMFTTVFLVLIFNTLSTFFYLRISINNILMNLNLKKTFKKKKSLNTPFYLLMTPLYLLML